jgi:hypothetical protein
MRFRLRTRTLVGPVFSLLLIPLAQCGTALVETRYSVTFVFINTSSSPATFRGWDYAEAHDHYTENVLVVAGGTGTTRIEEQVSGSSTALAVSVFVNGDKVGESGNLDTPISDDDDQVITVTAVWNGSVLTASVSAPCTTAPRAASTTGPSVAACQPATTWRLQGVTGNASGSWSDQSGTGTGTLTANFPQEVQVNGSYAISATFSGTFTAIPAWSGIRQNISVSICDRSPTTSSSTPLCGSDAASSKLLDRAELVASGSVTWSGTWHVTTLAENTSFTVEAGGGFTLPGTPLKLVATYSKVP